MSTRSRGYCLVSQQIRRRIIDGGIRVSGDTSLVTRKRFKNEELESRVQPSSFEPMIGNEIFILDTDQSVFMPDSGETVYKALLQLPQRQRQRIDITGGFELKRGFNYLIPLDERITLQIGEKMKASPKSSIGRLFPITRLIADYSSSFDQVFYENTEGREIQAWLLLQPTVFNLIVNPGDALNQLRFLKGTDVSLSQSEIMEEHERNTLLYDRAGEELTPSEVVITDDGLQISMDLTGTYTSGIIALRARDNPHPIDLSQKLKYKAEDYFEPVGIENGTIKFARDERYLVSSQGVLEIPSNLSAELRRHAGSGIRGEVDQAGFVDNGFKGDLVFEPNFHEEGGIVLTAGDNRVLSSLEFFRTNKVPDKTYGEKIGSHYQGQLGPRVSKHFNPFDFAHAAREFGKLDRMVLVHDADVLKGFRTAEEGFEAIRDENASTLITEIERNGFFHSRYDCETDEAVLQVIPYTILLDNDGRVFTYVRATDIQDYGDVRLFGKHSIGLGGHIVKSDGPNFVSSCLRREVFKEEVSISGKTSKPELVGTMLAYDKPVDGVHFGLIYKAYVKGDIVANESSITSFGMKTPKELEGNMDAFETWSRRLVPYLPLISKR